MTADRERFIKIHIDSLDYRCAWVREDAADVVRRVRILVTTPSELHDQARGSIDAAEDALVAALNQVREAKREYAEPTTPHLVAAE